MESFKEFMVRREHASKSLACGDAEEMMALGTDNEPASQFSSNGTIARNAKATKEAIRMFASQLGENGGSNFEIIQMGSGDLAFWTGLHHSTVEIGEDVVARILRVTEVFRREEGDWKLIHRHSDVLTSHSPGVVSFF